MSQNTVTQLDELAVMMPCVQRVRDAVKGATFVKAKTYTYLPHPSEIDKNSPEAQSRYKQYLAGAEFDEFPKQTLDADTGKLKLRNISYGESFNPELDYLKEDADGDGLSLSGLARSMFRNVAQVKWHIALADINGLPDVGELKLTIDQIKKLQEKSAIKQYSRESLWSYRYEKINGKKQLVKVVFKEIYRDYNDTEQVNSSYTDKEIYLILGLDEDGNYYQQKQVDGELGERNYPKLKGAEFIKFIPLAVVCDEEIESGQIPQELGYLAPICDLAYSRYVLSADYKEAMRALPPTTHVYGVSDADWAFFTKVNGREQVATGAGAVNIWRDAGTKIELVGADLELAGYERYLEHNAAKARAIGASFETDDKTDETATATSVNNFNKTARLNGAVDSIEESLTRLLAYCGMFNGLFTQEQILNNFTNVMEQCQVVLPRDFASAKLTTEEVKAYMMLRDGGIMPNDEVIKILEQGGWTISSAEELMTALEAQPPSLV